MSLRKLLYMNALLEHMRRSGVRACFAPYGEIGYGDAETVVSLDSPLIRIGVPSIGKLSYPDLTERDMVNAACMSEHELVHFKQVTGIAKSWFVDMRQGTAIDIPNDEPSFA